MVLGLDPAARESDILSRYYTKRVTDACRRDEDALVGKYVYNEWTDANEACSVGASN